MSVDCVFCKIVHGEIPCIKLLEDDETIAFMDINPVHDGHALVIPKEHGINLFEISPSAVSAVTRSAQRIAKAVQQSLKPAGLNLLQCNGEAAKQSVMHYHMHVLPRHMNDGASLNWELVPGDLNKIESLANSIKSYIKLV